MGHHTITTELQWSQGQLTNIHIHTDATYMWLHYFKWPWTLSLSLPGPAQQSPSSSRSHWRPPHSPLTWSMYTQVGGNWKCWWSKIFSPAWNTYTTDAAFEQHCDSTTTILSLLVHPFLPPFSLLPSHPFIISSHSPPSLPLPLPLLLLHSFLPSSPHPKSLHLHIPSILHTSTCCSQPCSFLLSSCRRVMKPTASDVDAASTEWFSSAEWFWGEQRGKGPWDEGDRRQREGVRRSE